MKIQDVWLVDLSRPWRAMSQQSCNIVSGKKFTWAEEFTGKRHLLGGSAFFLEAGAKRRRKHLLQQIVGNSYIRNMHAGKWERAYKAIMELQQ